jgi:hypothetical protein
MLALCLCPALYQPACWHAPHVTELSASGSPNGHSSPHSALAEIGEFSVSFRWYVKNIIYGAFNVHLNGQDSDWLRAVLNR